MSRRKKKGPVPVCEHCGRRVVFFRAWTDAYRPFSLLPVDPHTYAGTAAHPIHAGRAWLTEDLVEELMVRTSQSHGDALDEVYALPWHVLHVCPPTTEGSER